MANGRFRVVCHWLGFGGVFPSLLAEPHLSHSTSQADKSNKYGYEGGLRAATSAAFMIGPLLGKRAGL